jgi:putative transposase
MFIGYKFEIYPTKEQEKKIWNNIYGARFAYNWVISERREMLENGQKWQLSNVQLRNEFTGWKKNHKWLSAPSQGSIRGAIDDANKTFDKYFLRSRFRTKKNRDHNGYKEQFGKAYFQVGDSGFRLPKVGWVKTLANTSQLMGKRPYNIRINYDGLKYWCSFSVECENQALNNEEKTESIGIDLGMKTFATCSNGWVKESPCSIKYQKRLKRNQRKASKRYLVMNKGDRKSKRLIKLEKKILKGYKKISNIQLNFIHTFTSQLIKQNPERIVIEDVKFSDWAKDKHQREKASRNQYYEFRRQLEYKCEMNNIELVFADKYFPSTQMCSCCGHRKVGRWKLKRSERVYSCYCGNVMDRDFNASLNLKSYGLQ